MEIQKNPELLDRLASAYALGTLRGRARRRFEELARRNPTVRSSALLWQSRLQVLTEIQPSSQPSPVVWKRIDNLIQAEKDKLRANQPTKATQSVSTRWLDSIFLWRGATVAGVLCTGIAAYTALQTHNHFTTQISELTVQLESRPSIEYIAVLNDAQSNVALLVTFDPAKEMLKMQRVGDFQEAADQSLQLWAIEAKQRPRSLGVVSKDKLAEMTLEANNIKNSPVLAISLEPLGGVPEESGPTGPVLFKGAVIQKQI